MKIKSRAILLIVLLALFTQSSMAQVTIEEKSIEMPTYKTAHPEKSPIFFRNETYQGASRHYYPLKLNDQYTGERVVQKWNLVVLENPYIQLAVAPEIGGKIYYALDKTNNYNFIYRNNVVKPSNVGMTGAWVSGGIEWCVLHHHRASTFLPINYTVLNNKDSSKTIWIAEHEPRHGMRWTIGITAFADRSYFKAEGRVYNSTPYSHTFLYWANVATHTNENYQTIFPPSANVVTYHSKTEFAHWPISNEQFQQSDFSEGVDISWWKNVEKSNSFFVHDLQEDFMGGFDHGKNAGTVHIGNHHIVKGAKLWEWGAGERGQATEALLTEKDGPYVEIMVGAYSDNQPDYSWINASEVKKWEQYWYPVKGIRGFKNANIDAAVNIEAENNNAIFVGYYATRVINDAKIVLKNNAKIIYEKTIAISPDKPFAQIIPIKGKYELSNIYTELIDNQSNKTIISYQPRKQNIDKELPETWKGYPAPETINSIEELFLTGQRVEQFYAPQHNPTDWYREALRRDPGDIRTNTAMGKIYLKNGDFVGAQNYFRKAIERLTKDYTRPSDCEALYLQGVTLKALGLFNEAVDTLYRATWDYAYHSAAYFQLAQIFSIKKDYTEALKLVEKSLSTNTSNNKAVALKAALLRKLNLFEESKNTLKSILEEDPLDFRLRNEYYLLLRESGNQQSDSYLLTLNKEMRSFYDNYLEVAVGYINDGLLNEAEDVLLRYLNIHPLVDYYLGYIYDKKGNNQSAKKYFDKASAQSIDYVLPYRIETLDVLKTASKYNPDDANSDYYSGVILFEKQPDLAMKHWENAVQKNQALSMAYRNLGWGYYYHLKNIPQAITKYERAVALNKNEALFYTELDALYEQNNTPIEKRLHLFEGNEAVVKNRDDAFIRQIDVLTLAGKPEESVRLLDGVKFVYREGSSRNRDIIINAHLMLGKKMMKSRKYNHALESFQKALVQEEEAGGSQLGNREIQVNYYIGLAYEALGKMKEASNYFKKSASFSTDNTTMMDYYKGLSLQKNEKNNDAREVFRSMIANADKRLNNQDSGTIGITFSNYQAENTKSSINLTLRGLGYKGLGKTESARKDLKQAITFSASNLWALEEME